MASMPARVWRKFTSPVPNTTDPTKVGSAKWNEDLNVFLGTVCEALAALDLSADKLAYFTSANAAALTTLTSFGRLLIAANDNAAARALLGAVNIAGDTMAGDLSLGGFHKITGLAAPSAPSDAARKADVDAVIAAISGALLFKGAWDASAGTFPGAGAAQTGWFYKVSVAGTVNGQSFSVGDDVFAIVNNASTTTYASNWLKIEGTITAAEVIAALGFTPAPVANPVFTGGATAPAFTSSAGPANIGQGFIGDIAGARWGFGLNGGYKFGIYSDDNAAGTIAGAASPTYNSQTFYAKALWGKDGSLQIGGSFLASAGGYYNFGTVFGSSGYGLRDNAGTIEVKNSGGAWAAIGTVGTIGASRVSGLNGANNATTPNTKMDFSCSSVVLRNPSTGLIACVAFPGSLTCDVGLAGSAANGRDQSAAFTASSWLHFYYIWNGTTLATLASANAPSTGPTLPSGYTHWAYIGAQYFGATSHLSAVYYRGARVYYDARQQILTNGSASIETAITISAVVPPNALGFNVNVEANASGSGDFATHIDMRVKSGTTFERMTVSASNATYGGAGAEFSFPNVSQSFYYLFGATTNVASMSIDMWLSSYLVPNGGE